VHADDDELVVQVGAISPPHPAQWDVAVCRDPLVQAVMASIGCMACWYWRMSTKARLTAHQCNSSIVITTQHCLQCACVCVVCRPRAAEGTCNAHYSAVGHFGMSCLWEKHPDAT
jgi:hypothetical protein